MIDRFGPAQGEAMHDRRDVMGTLAPPDVVLPRATNDGGPLDCVEIPRVLAERALVALRATLTPRGHLAQRVTHEHLGYCSWRSESERCAAQRGLIDELTRTLEGP